MRVIILLWIILVNFFSMAEDKVITLAADPWCPWNCEDVNKPGIAVDLVKAVFEPYGYKVQYNVMPWTQAVEYGRQGKVTALIGASPTDPLVKGFVFPNKILNISNNVYVVGIDSDFTFKSKDSLIGKVIGIVKDYHFQSVLGEYIDANYNNENIIKQISGIDGSKKNIQELVDGKIDLYVDDEYVIQYNASMMKVDNKIRIGGFLNDNVGTYIAFSPAVPQVSVFATIYDEGVTKLKKDGTYAKILSKYGIYE